MALELSRWSPSLTAFADWLSSIDLNAGARWSQQLNSTEPAKVEAAVAEAVIWDFIGCRCDSVRLAENTGTGGIDFEFQIASGTFLVEVTNISIDAATRGSRMQDEALYKGFYGLLTGQIRQKVRRKFQQASRQSAHPLLVAVTTLHQHASSLCVCRSAIEFAMGSPPRITMEWDPRTGEAVGDLYQSTDLRQSVFLSPSPILDHDGTPIAQSRFEPISGFLVGGFGLPAESVPVLGGLNPTASRPFNPSLLPDVPFCAFKHWPVSREIEFSWTIGEHEEQRRKRQAAARRLRAAGHAAIAFEIEQVE